MRGTRAKQLRREAPTKAAYREAKRAQQGWRRAGFSLEVTVGLPGGGVPAGPVRWKYHPLRAVGKFFDDLTDKGKGIALNLMFGPAPDPSKPWDCGRRGAGSASRLSRPALLAKIAELQRYRDVKGYQRV